jgi:hypothetical protein
MKPVGSIPQVSGPTAETPRGPINFHSLAVIDELMAGGEILPTQLPSPASWSPEKRLAAAVLASALIEIRDHLGKRTHRRRVAEALEWIAAEDVTWPMSYLRLCALFDLDSQWVRAVVREWVGTSPDARKPVRFLYRHAA